MELRRKVLYDQLDEIWQSILHLPCATLQEDEMRRCALDAVALAQRLIKL